MKDTGLITYYRAKRHMISVSGLLKTSHRYPNLDYNDLMKLKSSMTLFTLVLDATVFRQVLDKFYGGQMDEATVEELKKDGK